MSHMNLAVVLALSLAATHVRAQAQTTQHYETGDGDEAPQEEDDGAAEEVPKAEPPAPATRPARPVFRGGRPAAARAATSAGADGSSSDAAPVISCSWSYYGFSPAPAPPALACTQSNGGQTVNHGSHGAYTCACQPVKAGSNPAPDVGSRPGSGAGAQKPPAAFQAGSGHGQDRIWSPMTSGYLFPRPPVSASGDSGRAIQFTADGAAHPNGIKLKIIDESVTSTPKEVVISAVPHSFIPVGGDPKCGRGGGSGFFIYLRYSTSALPYDKRVDCQLKAGGTYYINFRHHTSGMRGTAWSQFSLNER